MNEASFSMICHLRAVTFVLLLKRTEATRGCLYHSHSKEKKELYHPQNSIAETASASISVTFRDYSVD
jgi:hypothetical protein